MTKKIIKKRKIVVNENFVNKIFFYIFNYFINKYF